MIDLHCHLLWNMDDGASSMESTLALCEIAVRNQIRVIAATPHMTNLDMAEDFLYVRNRRLRELNRYLEDSHMPVRVCGGAEVYLDRGILEAEALEDLTLNHSRYLLCEYSLQPFDPDKALIYAEEVLERGLTPIIAHPERYPTFHRYPEIIDELKSMGAYFQVNADSLAGRLGDSVREMATSLIVDGTADLIATDAHHPVRRNNDFTRSKQSFSHKITPELLEWTTVIAPRRVLENKTLTNVASE